MLVKVGLCYLCIMVSCSVSEALTLRKGACLVKISSDSNQERENVADVEDGLTK